MIPYNLIVVIDNYIYVEALIVTVALAARNEGVE